jgi:hypothetical protein
VRLFPVLATALLGFNLSACAMSQMAPPQASLEGIQAVRAANLAPMNVGAFTPAPGAPTEMDKSISVRAGYQDAPGGSFARYLGDTLAAQLKSAGRFDPSATLVVSGLVTETHLDSLSSTSHGALGAKFTLVRDGKIAFEKTLRVEDSWDSNFLADVAIPDAINHYAGLFPKLVALLLADSDFRAAAR